MDDSPDFDDDPTDANSMERLLGWCTATLAGRAPAGWKAPTADELRTLASAQQWSIQCGPHVRPVDLISTPRRTAMRVTLMDSVSEELSAARRQWLAGLIDAANERRRLVRLGFDGDAQRTSIVAELDFTGCPPQWQATLIPTALAAVQHVTVQLLPTLSLLCDPRVGCDTWEWSLK
jgi:hypothetical protein